MTGVVRGVVEGVHGGFWVGPPPGGWLGFGLGIVRGGVEGYGDGVRVGPFIAGRDEYGAGQ